MKIILLVISIMFVLLLVGCNKDEKIDNTNTHERTDIQQQEIIQDNEEFNSNEENQITLISKINDTKDWVYDAEYEKNITAESYISVGKTYYARDIIVPFINVDSPYAERVNDEIKSIMGNLVEEYNEGVREDEPKTYINECRYEFYINDNILSGFFVYSVGQTDVPAEQYYVFSINLENGNKCTFEDIYTACGYKSNEIDSKIKEKIREKVSSYFDEKVDEDMVRISINGYEEANRTNSIRCFIDKDKKLNVIVGLSIPVGKEYYYKILTID